MYLVYENPVTRQLRFLITTQDMKTQNTAF